MGGALVTKHIVNTAKEKQSNTMLAIHFTVISCLPLKVGVLCGLRSL